MTFNKMSASMLTNETLAYVEMVPKSNIARRACSSQVNMLCSIDRYRLCDFHIDALAGQKGEFCDLVTLGHLYKIHHTRQFKRVYSGQYTINWGHLRDKASLRNSYRSLLEL